MNKLVCTMNTTSNYVASMWSGMPKAPRPSLLGGAQTRKRIAVALHLKAALPLL